jgi:hypothetical protein
MQMYETPVSERAREEIVRFGRAPGPVPGAGGGNSGGEMFDFSASAGLNNRKVFGWGLPLIFSCT